MREAVSMTTGALISEQDYLHTVYEPDVEFVDGRIVERCMGEQDHSAWQEALILWFGSHRKEWQLRARPELRVNVSREHYQVPDITLVRNDELQDQILTRPPIAVFEILSPEDRAARLFEKLEQYQLMGIPNIIIVEPSGARLHRKYLNGKMIPCNEGILRLDGTEAFVDWKEVEALLA
jgi:Uma2 family endonuclease